MEKPDREYFELRIETLQGVAGWAADHASEVLALYERAAQDNRPRAAVEGAREFASGGKRTNRLRKLALDAYRASLETVDPAASAAANAASLAAASAFTHPFRDVKQARHVLGPAVHAALAREVASGDLHAGDAVIEAAIASAPAEVAALLDEMPEQPVGSKRIDQLYQRLDRGIRTPLRS